MFGSAAELVDLCRRARSAIRGGPRACAARAAAATLAEHTFDHRVRVLESLWA